jgi:hypothetical protein
MGGAERAGAITADLPDAGSLNKRRLPFYDSPFYVRLLERYGMFSGLSGPVLLPYLLQLLTIALLSTISTVLPVPWIVMTLLVMAAIVLVESLAAVLAGRILQRMRSAGIMSELWLTPKNPAVHVAAIVTPIHGAAVLRAFFWPLTAALAGAYGYAILLTLVLFIYSSTKEREAGTLPWWYLDELCRPWSPRTHWYGVCRLYVLLPLLVLFLLFPFLLVSALAFYLPRSVGELRMFATFAGSFLALVGVLFSLLYTPRWLLRHEARMNNRLLLRFGNAEDFYRYVLLGPEEAQRASNPPPTQ